MGDETVTIKLTMCSNNCEAEDHTLPPSMPLSRGLRPSFIATAGDDISRCVLWVLLVWRRGEDTPTGAEES